MTAPAGMAEVFPGWNVWTVLQLDSPHFDPMFLGVSQDRWLRVWVEDELNENAPGTAVMDSANPAVLKGSQVQIIPSPGTLAIESSMPTTAAPAPTNNDDSPIVMDPNSVMQLAGTPSVVPAFTLDGPSSPRTVRFFNRGTDAVMPWPHDDNFVLQTVYRPSTTNVLTTGAAPTSLAGAAAGVGAGVSDALTAVAWGAGAVAVVLLLNELRKKRR